MLSPVQLLPRETPTQIANRPVIRFSHNYPKLHNQKSAYLLAVEPITIDDSTPEELLAYDTTTEDGNRFPLKHGQYIQLIFIGSDYRIPFCTIRARDHWFNGQKSDKFAYYRSKIGQIFNIDIRKADV